MKQFIIKLCRSVGISEAITNVILARCWSLLSGPISIILIGTRLTPEEQGLYYTFGGIVAAKMFLELGLIYVIIQFVSHEMVGLKWKDGILVGEIKHKERVSSIARMALRWYAMVAILVIAILIPLGLWFFSNNLPTDSELTWKTPWICLVVVSAVSLLLTPMVAIIEGTGRVAEVSRRRMFEGMALAIALWIGLLTDIKLYAVVVSSVAGLIVMGSWLLKSNRAFFRDLFLLSPGSYVGWKTEILPLQWRMALIWISGYLSYQLFTPMLFKTHGPVVSGQFGMTFTLMSVVSAVSLSWLQTRAPEFGTLSASGKNTELARLFRSSFWQSLGVFIFGCIGLLTFIIVINALNLSLATRLLDLNTALFLMSAMVLTHTVFTRGVYFRSMKREPFVFLFVIKGLIVCAVLLFLAPHLQVYELLRIYAFGVCLPVAVIALYISRRLEKNLAIKG